MLSTLMDLRMATHDMPMNRPEGMQGRCLGTGTGACNCVKDRLGCYGGNDGKCKATDSNNRCFCANCGHC